MLGDGTVHPSSHINPAVLSQLMSTVAVQEQIGGQLYVPPPPPQQLDTQPPMQRNESEQHESRRNRPAAIPIKPPPGIFGFCWPKSNIEKTFLFPALTFFTNSFKFQSEQLYVAQLARFLSLIYSSGTSYCSKYFEVCKTFLWDHSFEILLVQNIFEKFFA